MTLAYPQCYHPVYLPLPRSLLRWGEPHRTRNILQYMNEEGCCCHIHMSHRTLYHPKELVEMGRAASHLDRFCGL